MIIKLDQHSIILEKSWIKKHEANYHEHDDFISFHFNHCSHLNVFERSFSNQLQTKKKNSVSKRDFFNQSEIIEKKEIKIFFEKTNNSKIILKRSVNFSERLIERSKRLIERRINESWRKKLKKIEISSSRILRKESKMNFFYDEISSKFHEKSTDEENIIEIHSIAIVSFNILFR
jgi:S-adenosylmethionine:tRNA-ribosyltransferase-isomerase (queuine synthetase)